MISAETLRKAREVTGDTVALDVDAILSAAALYDMLSEKGKAGVTARYNAQRDRVTAIFESRR